MSKPKGGKSMRRESNIPKEAAKKTGFEAIRSGEAITVDDLSGTDDLELNLALTAALAIYFIDRRSDDPRDPGSAGDFAWLESA
jgi:hypothetical protein